MARGKKKNSRSPRPPGEAAACIACGFNTTFSGELGLISKEREEWKSLEEGDSAIVKSKDVEGMYFHKEPWLWTSFVRAILDRPYVEHLCVSGITQERMNVDFGPSPVPRDPQRARIGNALKNPSKHFAQYQRVDMSHPERNDKNQQIGYLIHAHCWVLLDHVIGHELIERNLRIFLNAITKFWKENHALWNPLLLDDDYDGTFYPIHQRLRETPQTTENNYIKMECVDTLQNPVIVPEIRALINQTVRACFENDDRSARPRQTVAFDVPLEIAMMIVNVIYDNIYYNQASIYDLRNMLTAFQWRLPNSYWQSRCKKYLIFEFDELIRNNQTVDWQFLCLRTEELFLKDGWYDGGGLKNRGRILQLLQGLKKIFLEMIE